MLCGRKRILSKQVVKWFCHASVVASNLIRKKTLNEDLEETPIGKDCCIKITCKLPLIVQ